MHHRISTLRHVNLSNTFYKGYNSNFNSDSDALPIYEALSRGNKENIAVVQRLFLKALNQNQIILLNHIGEDGVSLNAFLNKLSKMRGIPLSTLKLNARILKELYLIDYGCRSERIPVTLTPQGKAILKIINFEDVKEEIK